ncbi:TonB-dependent siderophore receptor [Paraburkholderia caribensis]|uniref:TonB-dependent siderophore receptor n=1 Tax=Paraburkholderia caribensis TaxID=75105 RepID=UPI0007217295|nr:TonB-dependent receptor [Paraburkholderia caribensis]ALP68499.1 hypothetical protein AN416_37840 [Paraburkholderia caribensis]AUT57853.1 TonB-dependent siderophore receptor [Paraburkholderia caribensis]
MKKAGVRKFKFTKLSIHLFLAFHASLLVGIANAQSTTAASSVIQYDVAAGPLDRVLVAIASVNRKPISFDEKLASRYSSPGVKGSMTVEQAIDHALIGTALERATTPDGALTVKEKQVREQKNAGSAEGTAPVLPAITVHDSTTKSDVTSFTAPTTSSATLTDTPASETPMSVQSVTQGVMRSQQATTVTDTLRNVSGVSVVGSGIGQATVEIRGFTAPVSTDGLVTNSAEGNGYTSGLDIPLIGVERVDVVKGADSIIAGGTNPGGVVNVIRKQPQADPVYELQTQVGSYGEALLGADAGGALSKNMNLNYRFVINGERTGESYGGAVGERSLYIAPSIGYQTAQTNFVVGLEQNTEHEAAPYYSVFLDGKIAPINHSIGTEDDHLRVNSTNVYYNLSQQIVQGWTLKSKAAYNTEVESFGVTETSGSFLDDEGDAVFVPLSGSIRQRAWSLQNSVEGKFSTGPVSHDLVFGFNYQRTLVNAGAGVDAAGVAIANIYTYWPTEDIVPVGEYTQQNGYSNQFYLQDQMKYGRFRLLSSISHGQSWSQTSTSSSTNSAWSPNVGLLYQLTDDIATYASYQKTFTPQGNILLVGGAAASAETGVNTEVGVKGEFLDDKLTASAALYRTQLKNRAIADGAVPGYNMIDPVGVVSKGVEIDVSGQISPGLKVVANYSYNAQTQPSGPDIRSAYTDPRHRLFVWGEYAFQSAMLSGFGINGGVTIRSSYTTGQSTSTSPIYRIGGQAIVDAGVFYRKRKWVTSFGVRNLFDRAQIGPGALDSYVPILPGRTFLLTSIYQF